MRRNLTYTDVDEVLYFLVDRPMRPAELIERVAPLVRSAQDKRHTPPIAKVSARTIEQDFLYLRDWGD